MNKNEIEKLYTEHYEGLKAFAYAMCQRQEDAEDIVSQIFTEMLENVGNLQIEDPKRYLYRATHNRTIDYYRKNNAKSRAFGDIDCGDEPDCQDYPELHKSIACLPDRQAVAIYLHYWQKMSYEQIADEMQIPIKTVDTLLYRAKNKLREMMRNG